MAVEPAEFLKIAETSLAQEGEISWRNAVSRAYYGVFHLAQSSAKARGWPEYAAGATHERLAALYVDQGKRALGYRLKHMHRLRCNADYDIATKLSLATATDQVGAARKLADDVATVTPVDN